MRRILAFTAALALGLIPISSYALGLGDIKLNSALNQKFDADIPVVAAASDDVSSLSVALASQDAFDRAGVERVSTLVKLHFDVVHKDGRDYIHVTTNQPVKDPFLTFLVQADWSSGKLVREYTVLLDPPVFTPAKPSQTQTPVAGAATEPTTQGAPAPAGSSAAYPAAAASGSAAPAPQGETNGSTYGPIRRGQTLWGIANRVRSDDVSVNQMMVALYRSNPDAFMGNINRMKAGYILRVPSASEVRGISRAQANAAVRRANQDWRGGASAEPVAGGGRAEQGGHIQLVAPSGGSQSGASVPGAGSAGSAQLTQVQQELSDTKEQLDKTQNENDQLSAQVQDLQGQLDETKRLVTVKDNQLQALQQKVQTGATTPPEAAQPKAGQTQPPQPAEVQTAPVTKPAPTKPEPIQSAPPQKVSLLSMLRNHLVSLAEAVGVLVLVLVAVLGFMRKRRASTGSASAGMPVFGDEDETVVASDQPSDDDWLAGEETAGGGAENAEEEVFAPGATATISGAGATEEQEETPDSEKTMMMEPGEAQALADTMTGGQAVKLDDSDPLAEADFHMAYGLYDQAGDLIRRALDKEPGRRDLTVKLLEVYFASGQAGPFVEAAKELRTAMGDAPDSDWENVAIMGRQIAPDESLFAESGGTVGGAVDLDFAAEESGAPDTTDLDVFSTVDESGAGLDFDIAETGATETAAGSTDEDIAFELPEADFGATGGETEAGAPAAAEAKGADAEDAGMDFDLGDFDFETSTATGTTSPVETVSEAEGSAAGEVSGETTFTGLETQAGAESTFTGLETGTGAGAGEETTFTGLETEVMTEAGSDGTGAGEAAVSDAGLGVESSEPEDLSDTQNDFDKALSELSQYVDTNFPSDGQEPEAGAGGEELALAAETAGADAMAAETEDSFAASPEDEVSTKLDLASAYIEMGDPDGARSILEEVLEEGNDMQKQEAQKLLAQVS